jgi:hypothetical protein
VLRKTKRSRERKERRESKGHLEATPRRYSVLGEANKSDQRLEVDWPTRH